MAGVLALRLSEELAKKREEVKRMFHEKQFSLGGNTCYLRRFPEARLGIVFLWVGPEPELFHVEHLAILVPTSMARARVCGKRAGADQVNAVTDSEMAAAAETVV